MNKLLASFGIISLILISGIMIMENIERFEDDFSNIEKINYDVRYFPNQFTPFR